MSVLSVKPRFHLTQRTQSSTQLTQATQLPKRKRRSGEIYLLPITVYKRQKFTVIEVYMLNFLS